MYIFAAEFWDCKYCLFHVFNTYNSFRRRRQGIFISIIFKLLFSHYVCFWLSHLGGNDIQFLVVS
jgi:hypothetical protein